ncbi:MAG: hypothetical protein JWP12_2808 [Bacteroidetes bacterium]|nr:hypothetical protein [Bacteroidota bacterium]
MEATISEKIVGVVNVVRDASYYEKTHIQSLAEQEEIINNFLDSINGFKKELQRTISEIEFLTGKFEELTWYTGLSENELKALNELIASSKDLRSVLIKKYVSYNEIRRQGIAKTEIICFKHSIDDFTEAYKDLESVFFFLPQNKEFQDITNKLSDL